MIGNVGIAPEKYWSYTLRENTLLATAFQNRDESSWMKFRNVEYAIYNTSFSMNGKKIFKSIKKPQDLYSLPSEERKKNSAGVLDIERATKAWEEARKLHKRNGSRQTKL